MTTAILGFRWGMQQGLGDHGCWQLHSDTIYLLLLQFINWKQWDCRDETFSRQNDWKPLISLALRSLWNGQWWCGLSRRLLMSLPHLCLNNPHSTAPVSLLYVLLWQQQVHNCVTSLLVLVIKLTWWWQCVCFHSSPQVELWHSIRERYVAMC